jgi:hypothetical protein
MRIVNPAANVVAREARHLILCQHRLGSDRVAESGSR